MASSGPLRLEVIRDGIEDFDYLSMSDELVGQDASKPYIYRISRNLSDWDQDPWKLEATRREVGKAIEKAVKLRLFDKVK